MHTKRWLDSLNGIGHLEDLGTDDMIILKQILRKENGCVNGIHVAQAVFCEHGNASLQSHKMCKFLD
jgi:hypothetical protein